MISKGAVPDQARGLFHMAPTYLYRFPGSAFSIGCCGSPFFTSIKFFHIKIESALLHKTNDDTLFSKNKNYEGLYFMKQTALTKIIPSVNLLPPLARKQRKSGLSHQDAPLT